MASLALTVNPSVCLKNSSRAISSGPNSKRHSPPSFFSGNALVVKQWRCTRGNASTASRAVVSASLPHAWSARAIKTFGMAELEARKLKYPTTGTEALLMGMFTEGTSLASKFLRARGLRLLDLREETVKLLGKADMYFFSPEHPPLTEPAAKALEWAISKHQEKGGTGEIEVEHIVLGVWTQRDSAGHKLLATLGFSDALAEELQREMDAVKV